MLAVAVHLLTGRYGATHFNDRNSPEWPPHPARLFSALVAAWGDADEPDPDERAALVWLEAQPPPDLLCSDWENVMRREVVTVYVPGNDPSASSRGLDKNKEPVALEVLPNKRNRQPRAFPSVTPPDPTVHFVWRDATPTDATLEALDCSLGRVARLGHSATLVSCVLTTGPAESPTLVPRTGGHDMLRVPRAGLLARLEREFESHEGVRERLLPAVMAAYDRPKPSRPAAPAGQLSGDWILLSLPRRAPNTNRMQALRNTRSLDLTRAVRTALLEHADSEAGILSGRWTDGWNRPHVAVVPLASVGHRWADGTVHGVALILPSSLASADRAVVEGAVAAWRSDGFVVRLADPQREVAVEFEYAMWVPAAAAANGVDWTDWPLALRRWAWCRPARQWISVTPVALDRAVPGLHDGRDGAEQAARASLARSCSTYGLPEPTEVAVGTAGMTAAVPASPGRSSPGRRTFPRYVAEGTGQHKQCVHAMLTFAEPVRGPVLIGSGRYLGYGLFLPIREDER
jgi:CRISPR-associated protein Csb2